MVQKATWREKLALELGHYVQMCGGPQHGPQLWEGKLWPVHVHYNHRVVVIEKVSADLSKEGQLALAKKAFTKSATMKGGRVKDAANGVCVHMQRNSKSMQNHVDYFRFECGLLTSAGGAPAVAAAGGAGDLPAGDDVFANMKLE